jgi:hypothetical protein
LRLAAENFLKRNVLTERATGQGTGPQGLAVTSGQPLVRDFT